MPSSRIKDFHKCTEVLHNRKRHACVIIFHVVGSRFVKVYFVGELSYFTSDI